MTETTLALPLSPASLQEQKHEPMLLKEAWVVEIFRRVTPLIELDLQPWAIEVKEVAVQGVAITQDEDQPKIENLAQERTRNVENAPSKTIRGGYCVQLCCKFLNLVVNSADNAIAV